MDFHRFFAIWDNLVNSGVEMVHAIELSVIEVQIYHGEAAPGQVCLYLLVHN